MAGSLDELHGYHAHIYYNNDSFNNTKSIAEKLRDTLRANFPVEIGKFSGIAGPHLFRKSRSSSRKKRSRVSSRG